MSSYTNIGGIVSDRDGQPLAGATIQVAGRVGGETVSSPTGSYRLLHVAPGPLELLVTPPGGETQRITLTVPSDGYDINLD